MDARKLLTVLFDVCSARIKDVFLTSPLPHVTILIHNKLTHLLILWYLMIKTNFEAAELDRAIKRR